MLLFYRSFWAILWFPVVWSLVRKQTLKREQEQKNHKLQMEFLHGIGVLNASLQAGLSMENAWREVEKEIYLLYGESSEFYLEIKEINKKVAHNQPIEKLFLAFAYQRKIESLIQFAELLEYGKRSGNNWKKMIDSTVSKMMEQEEAKQEIEVMVAEKKMEQKVMNIMPLGLLAFLQFTAWDYMEVLYHNWFGIISMTLMLVGYVGFIWFSQRLLKVAL